MNDATRFASWKYSANRIGRLMSIVKSVVCVDSTRLRLDLIMVALRSICGHYIFALWFLSFFFLSSFFLLSSFFHRLISAVADCMSTILLHMVWISADLKCRSEMCCAQLAGNAGRKRVAKNRHLGTIAQLCRGISSQLRHASTIRKKLVRQQYLSHMSLQYGELRSTSG